MPIEIRELVINASLKDQAKEAGPSNTLLQSEDQAKLHQKIEGLEKKLQQQSAILERKILKECLAEVKELLNERERKLR